MTVVFSILGLLFIGWGIYQIRIGSAYLGSAGGDLILSSTEWIDRADSPARFWLLVIIEIAVGSFFIYFGILF